MAKLKPCPIEIQLNLGKYPPSPKLRNAIQRCHYRSTTKEGDTSLQESLDEFKARAEAAEKALLEAQEEIKRLKSKPKKKKKSSEAVK